MTIKSCVTGCVAAAVLLVSGSAIGAGMTELDRRNAVMHGIAGHMKALGAVAKGEAAADAATPIHAKAIQELAASVPMLFHNKDAGAKSRSKPELWSDWDGFMTASDNFQAASAALVKAAKGGDAGAIGAALGGVGKTCGGCHKPYRGPKVE